MSERRIYATHRTRDPDTGGWLPVHGVTVILAHPRGAEWGGPYIHHSAEWSVDLELRSGGAVLGALTPPDPA